MRIYFAAPLFNAAEQRFNARLTWQLEDYGHSVFLPQRDGFEMASATEDAGRSPEEIRDAIFSLDVDEVLNADLVLAVLDGRVPDEGVCIEIGIAWAARNADPQMRGTRRIFGLKTDVRTSITDQSLNPMVAGAIDELFTDEATLLAWLLRESLPADE